MSITPEQVAAARQLLGWTKVRLACRSNTSEGTVKKFEAGAYSPPEKTVAAMREALEFEGIELTPGQPGVRLRKG